MADVFISHSGKSPEAAEAIANELERVRISCWFAKRSIQPGQSFPKEIQKAIKNCKVFLLVLDKNSNQSEHVLNEINLAFRRKNNHEAIEFVVFKTDDCKVSVDIDYFLNRFQHMEGAPPDAQHIQDLACRISNILGVEIPLEKPQTKEAPPKKSKLPIICAVIALLLTVVVGVTVWQTWKSVPDKQSEPDHIEWTLEDGVLTIFGKGPMENYEYECAFEDKDIVYTNIPWWEQKDDIISIVMEKGITSIGDHAFEECRRLRAVTISESVTSIGEEAFSNCISLTTVNIPDSVTSIGLCSFLGCVSLTAVIIPDSVTSIDEGAFEDCSSLKAVNIPNGVANIELCTFLGCDSLTAVTIPDSVTNIGEAAFANCLSLTVMTIPNSVTSIERCAFEGCTNLMSINLPNSVTSIGDSSFEGCESLTDVTIPDGVTHIEAWTFSGCWNLKSVSVPANVEIDETAFDKPEIVTRRETS